MTTTFQSREAVRDELVTLFTNNGSWQEVYGYAPDLNEVIGKTPILIIRSEGTSQRMEGDETNPASYQFAITTWVLAYSEDGNWTSANAEDKIDELDKVVRQVIRNNAGGGSNADQYRFDPAQSEVGDVILHGGVPYMVESRLIYADLPRGAV